MSVSILSPEMNLVKLSLELGVKGDKLSGGEFVPLLRVQSFFCDYLPVAANFIFVLNSVRSKLHDINKEYPNIDLERKAILEKVQECDQMIGKAYLESIDWTVRRAHQYFHEKGKNELVTVSLTTFYKSGSTEVKALRTRTAGKREEPPEFDLSKNAVLSALKARPPEGSRVKPIHMRNVPEAYLGGSFRHPCIEDLDSNPAETFRKDYHSPFNKFTRLFRKKKMRMHVGELWRNLWDRGCTPIGSLAAFPVTLANNILQTDINRHFFGSETGLDKSEVFSAVMFESEILDAFDVEDQLFGRILADAFFVFDGAMTHYRRTSSLRKRFGDVELSN